MYLTKVFENINDRLHNLGMPGERACGDNECIKADYVISACLSTLYLLINFFVYFVNLFS